MGTNKTLCKIGELDNLTDLIRLIATTWPLGRVIIVFWMSVE